VPTAEIFVVDDGSTDDTAGAGRLAGATVLRHPRNLGKGAALGTGIARALAGPAPVIVTLDADAQHPPGLIAALTAPIAAGEADLVLGARHRGGPMPLHRRLTNWLSARLVSRATGQAIADAQTGFRAFSRRVAFAVRPAERYYDFEAAFLFGVLMAGFRVRSVPIPTLYGGTPSHFRTWGDTWRVVRVYARHARPILVGER
jgi:glycosyltransferase involved in cell wall biosynthesis